VGVRSFQVFNGQAPFEQGGDPTNDSERYEALSEDMIDGNTPIGQSGDYRVLLSCGPFASLAPDQAITFAYAMVVGEGLDGLLESAAEAALTYRGLRFDRDGDPETGPDGKEYAVHWLSPGEIAVPAVSGSLLAARRDGGVRLEIEARHADVADLAVERRSATGATERRWELADLPDLVATPFGARVSLTDAEADGAARYALLHEAGGGAAVLAEAQVAAPAARLELAARPNPFNPRVELSFRLGQAGPVRLEIFSARGEKVRTLLSRSLPAGPFTAFWEGEDDAGGAVASGVYLVRLEAPEGRLLKRLTLLR
jgi:hypothetical protein